MDRGAWWATVHGVTKSQTLSDFTFLKQGFSTLALLLFLAGLLFVWECPVHGTIFGNITGLYPQMPVATSPSPSWWSEPRGKPKTAPSSVQFSLVSQSSLTLYDPMDCNTPGFPIHHQLPKLAQMHIHFIGDAIPPSHPLSYPSPAFNLSQHQGLFQWVQWVLHIRWPKYWSFSFSISPSNEHSGLISFRIDWLDLLAVQGTLKSLLQHHSSKASILQCSAFFMVQLSHPYMTIGKTITLTIRAFVGKVKSLLFNMLFILIPIYWQMPMSSMRSSTGTRGLPW